MDVQQDIDECEDVEGGVWAVVIRSTANRRNQACSCNSHEKSMNYEVFLFPLDTSNPNQSTTRCTDQEECAKNRCRGVEL